MGSILGKAMEENLMKNQEFMIATQRAQLERQIHMQNAMREQQMAIQIARSRDLFQWWLAFYITYGAAAIVGVKKTGNKFLIGPILPMTFIVAYIGDLAYGTKMTRVKNDAGDILKNELSLLDLPQPLPTLESIDERRHSYKEKQCKI